MSHTILVDINMRSRGEAAFLGQIANIRQALGEKNV